jgi:uncharacterized membrane protein
MPHGPPKAGFFMRGGTMAGMFQFSLMRLMQAATYAALAFGAVRFSMESKQPDLAVCVFHLTWVVLLFWKGLARRN